MNKIITLCVLSFCFLISSIYAQEVVIPGKVLFSDKPFASGSAVPRSSFSSNEFIYGRFELASGTIREAFRIKESKGYYFLVCRMEVLKNGEPVGYHTHNNNYILLAKEDLDKNGLNLDVLPEPGKGTTLYSMTDDFSAGYGFTPLYSMINPDFFPAAGTSRVNVRIYFKTKDMYDRDEDQDKWPYIEGGFDFTLREADVPVLKKNAKLNWEHNEENAFRYDKLPAAFSNPATITDPKATNAKIAAILKRDLPQRTILKFAVEKYNGTLWSIANNDLGIPKYRYFNPHVWVAYKEDGKCYVGHVTLRENYSGGGTYGPLGVGFTTASDSGGDRGIDCGKIK
jgi:hypothetical protein